MKIRGRTVGGGADPTDIINTARSAADAFLAENQDWTNPFK